MAPVEEPFGSYVESWRWLYAELLRIEQHWTDQVQSQQQRIHTLLSVTGILLAFLAGAGFFTGALTSHHWPVYIYVSSLIVLCAALFMGILTLEPSTPISGTPSTKPDVDRPLLDLWLNPEAIYAKTASSTELEVLRELCKSAAENSGKAHHEGTLRKRRALMFRQIAFLLLSLGLLIVALVGFLITGQ